MKLKDQNSTLISMFGFYFGTVSGAFADEWEQKTGYITDLPGPIFGHISNGLYAEQTIDLVGYSMAHMTFATFDTMYQDGGMYQARDAAGTAASTLNQLQTLEIITTAPLGPLDIEKIVEETHRRVPGMIGTDQNFKQIIYGRYSVYSPNSTLGPTGYLQLVQSQGFGSKEPTAADRLYCYRILIPKGATAGDTLQVPACRIGLKGRFYHEDENSYVMRLRRNYLLQQGD